MKAGWQTKTIGEVCDIRPPKSEARQRAAPDEFVSFAAMEDLGIHRKFLNATQVRPLGSVIGSYTYFADGDVLLAKITPCFENGKLGVAAGLSNGIGFGSSEFMVLRPRPTLDSEYLYYFLSREDFRSDGAARMGGAVGQQRVPQEFVERYPIPLPPLPDQRRIVAILDAADDNIASARGNAEMNLARARAIFESCLEAVFAKRDDSWVEARLGDLASFRNGINYTKASNGERVRVVGVKTFQKHFIAPMDNLDIVTVDGQLAESDLLRRGDILTVRSNGNVELIGRSMLVDTVPERTAHSGFTIRLRLSGHEVLPRYLCYFMSSSKTRKSLIAGGTGTNIKSLNQGMLSALMVPFPPVAQQRLLMDKLDELTAETHRLAEIYRDKLTLLDALSSSLLHSAFNGQLVRST